MKRTIVLLATLLLSFGLISAQNNVDFYVPGDTIWTGEGAEFVIAFENDAKLGGYSTGFEIWSDDGATWTYTAGPDWYGYDPVSTETLQGFGISAIEILAGCRQDPPGTVWDLTGFLVTEQDVDLVSPDMILVGGTALSKGMLAGPLEDQVVLHFDADNIPIGEVRTMCFDSVFVPPAGAFVFVDAFGGAFTPVVLAPEGGRCYPVIKRPNVCPVFADGLAVSMNVDHCGSNFVNLSATDEESDPIFFALNSMTGGVGTPTVTDNGDGTCKVSYIAAAADFGNAISIVVDVWDAANPQGVCGTHTIAVTVTNNAPTIDCGAFENPIGQTNTLVKKDIVGGDADDCDALTYGVVSVTPAPNGVASIDTEGEFTMTTTVDDGDVTYTVVVSVTDGLETATCSFEVAVLSSEPYEVRIEKAHGVLQGHFVDLDITLALGSEALGGFDLLMAYDPTTLTFTEANMGTYFQGCGWEFFTYRYGSHGNCGNGCPSGEIRLIGMAETNNGPFHPDVDCIKAGRGEVLATMTFFVTNDYNVGGMFLPVKFFWMDCGDNTMSVFSGDTLGISRYVYNYLGDTEYDPIGDSMIIIDTWFEVTDNTWGFPGMYGAPTDPCMDGDKVTPVRFIDLFNGGIDVIHPSDIDDRGDINVNGIKNEIADAVMFTNYFIGGLSAFGTHVEASIAASDVNADGIALTVADLVYQVRIIIGDALPYPKPVPGAFANFELSQSNGVATVSVEASDVLGAALFIFNVNGSVGAPVAVDAASGMKVATSFADGELRVLVYDLTGNNIASEGNVLSIPVNGTATLESVEAGAWDGYVMETTSKTLPTHFMLDQNYPNPFNPATAISFNLSKASDWNLSIYNVAGQLVRSFTGYNEASTQTVTWDGNDNSNAPVASGIYFYKLTAGDFTATKKMVLMK